MTISFTRLQWSLASPEIVRLVGEFQQSLPTCKETDDDFHHHEESKSFQKMFHDKSKQLYDTIKKYGNPFQLSHSHLLKLDIQEAFEQVVFESISTLEQKGQEQYEKYRKEVLEEGTKSVHDTIKKNSFPLLNTP